MGYMNKHELEKENEIVRRMARALQLTSEAVRLSEIDWVSFSDPVKNLQQVVIKMYDELKNSK